MLYDVSYHPAVKTEDLPPIPHNMRARIRTAIERRLMREPVKYGDPLKRSLSGYRKLRVGDYRVIYKVDNQTIIILKIGHRKEVYNKTGSRIKEQP